MVAMSPPLTPAAITPGACKIHLFAISIACLHWELPAVHYLVGFSGNKVPLAAYATYLRLP